MSAPSRAPKPGHIHLPSVHIRQDGTGFDYTEDIYVHGRGARQRLERVIRLEAVERGRVTLIRETRDTLCAQERIDLQESMWLMNGNDPEAKQVMTERARFEFERQVRIIAGEEHACARCGCSESRSCSGGCIWAARTLCSRCV